MPTLTTAGVAEAIVATLISQGVVLDDEAVAATEIAGHLTDWLGGADAVPVDLSLKLNGAIGNINTDQLQRLEWWSGTADGGPNSDGLYPMTNAAGVTVLFPSLAKIFATVGTVGDPAAVIAEVQALVDEAAASALELGATSVQGSYPAGTGSSTSATAAVTFIPTLPIDLTGTLLGLSVRTANPSVAKLCLLSKNGSNEFTLLSSKDVLLLAGVNTFLDWNPDVTAGQFIGVYLATAGIAFDASGGPGLRYTAGVPGTNTASTNVASAAVKIGWEIQSGGQLRLTLEERATARADTLIAGEETVQETYPATDGNSTLGAGLTIFGRHAATVDGLVSDVSAYAATAGEGAIAVVSINGDGTAKLEYSVPATFAAGANSFANLALPILVGQYVAAFSSGAFRYTAPSSGDSLIYTTGLPGAATAKTTTGNCYTRLGWKIQPGLTRQVLAERARSVAAEAALTAFVTDPTQTGGGMYPATVQTDHIAAAYTCISEDPVAATGRLSSVSVDVGAAGPGKLMLVSKSGANFTRLAEIDVVLGAGVNTINWATDVAAGQYLALYCSASAVGWVAATGKTCYYLSGLPTTSTAGTAHTNKRFALGWKVAVTPGARTAASEDQIDVLQAQVAAMPAAGVGLLASADKTGVTDATSIVAAALAAHPTPYVPPGLFSVTALARQGAGLWGPGKVEVGGVRVPLPLSPSDGGLVQNLRSAHARLMVDNSPLVLISDSIGAHFTSTTLAKSWFNRVEDALNREFAPGSEPDCIVTRDRSPDTAAFYGVSFSASVGQSSRGPAGVSSLLGSGEYIEFTGAYAEVGAFYRQVSGAGSLVFSFNGTPFSTINCAGATQLDKYSGSIATGQTGSGTYRIAASGGDVDVSGLVRHAAKISTAGTPLPIYCQRHAFGGYYSYSFTDTRIDSSLAQATGLAGGTQPEYIVSVGTNDMLTGATSPRLDTYKTNMARIFARLQAAGVKRISALGMIRPNYSQWSTYYASPQDFDRFIGGLIEVCRDYGVPLLRLDQFDFYGAGYLVADGLHPGDLGHAQIFEMWCRWRSAN